jgi:hypothetical protein
LKGPQRKAHRTLLLEYISKDAFEISCNFRGTHSIQALIGSITDEDEIKMLFDAIGGDLLKLAYNTNGSFVLQKIILAFPEDRLDNIYLMLIKNFMKLATDANGLPVVNLYMLLSLGEEKFVKV